MSCSDLADWYLTHRIAVLDTRSATLRRAWRALVPPGYTVGVCVQRLEKGGRIRSIGRGLYVPVDPVRATPPIAIASGLFREAPHYVTTDAALAYHGLIDQPVPEIRVVVVRRRQEVRLDQATVVRPVTIDEIRVAEADAFDTTVQAFAVRVASREQAVVDALCQPRWMVHGDLLAEVLAAFSDKDLDRTAAGAREKTTAAAQRLGYLIEEAGRAIPKPLADLKPVRAVELRPSKGSRGRYSTRWRVYG